MILRFPMFLVPILVACAAASAQNPIQWSGNAQMSAERAREQSLPLMFWVTDRSDPGDDDDLRDAQEASFRDPAVVAITHKCYVPVRVSRNSRVLSEAEKLGLPTNFGLYIALVTPDGRLLAEIDPGVVATPGALAARLQTEYAKYRDALYERELKPLIIRPDAPKNDVRLAVQKVWRMGIVSADADIVGLLGRKDLTSGEKNRIYMMLGSFATGPAIGALLERAAAGEKEAATALGRAEAGALEWLVGELPAGDGQQPSDRQIAAYRAVAQVARSPMGVKPDTFWETTPPEQQQKLLDHLRQRAETVLEYWKDSGGRTR